MEIVWLILVGAVVGVLARLLLPGRDPVGLIGTILVGVVGAFLGYYLSDVLPGDNEGVPWIASIICAMVLLWIARMVMGRRPTTRDRV